MAVAVVDADAEVVALRVSDTTVRDVIRPTACIAWVFALLLHILLLLALLKGIPPHPLELRAGDTIRVELIDAPIPAPAVAPLVVEPLSRAQSTSVTHAGAATATKRHPAIQPDSAHAPATVQKQTPTTAADSATEAAQAAPAMRFYNPDSSANIPKDLLAQVERSMPKPNFTAKEFVLPEFMQHKNPLHYLATDFEPSWVPINENLLDEFVRRNLTREVTFKTPWGGTIRCTWVFVMGACAGVPPAAWKNPDKKTLPMPAPAPEWQ